MIRVSKQLSICDTGTSNKQPVATVTTVNIYELLQKWQDTHNHHITDKLHLARTIKL